MNENKSISPAEFDNATEGWITHADVSGCRYPRPCSGTCCDERYATVTITLGRKP